MLKSCWQRSHAERPSCKGRPSPGGPFAIRRHRLRLPFAQGLSVPRTPIIGSMAGAYAAGTRSRTAWAMNPERCMPSPVAAASPASPAANAATAPSPFAARSSRPRHPLRAMTVAAAAHRSLDCSSSTSSSVASRIPILGELFSLLERLSREWPRTHAAGAAARAAGVRLQLHLLRYRRHVLVTNVPATPSNARWKPEDDHAPSTVNTDLVARDRSRIDRVRMIHCPHHFGSSGEDVCRRDNVGQGVSNPINREFRGTRAHWLVGRSCPHSLRRRRSVPARATHTRAGSR
jgi:hypothetical protein